MLHDTISRKAAIFLQLSTGLSVHGLLDVMKIFPNFFIDYFVHSKEHIVTAEMFLSKLVLPDTGHEEKRVITMLKKYVESCSSNG